MSDELKRCPACAELIQAAAHKCRYCGTDLDAYVAAHEASTEQTLFTGHPKVIYTFGQYVVAVCTLGIALLVYWVRSLSLTFTVTTQRVRVERGLFSKVQDNVELFRVDHFDVIKPLGMRLLGLCRVQLHSSDPEMPTSISSACRDWRRWPIPCASARCASGPVAAYCRWSRCSDGRAQGLDDAAAGDGDGKAAGRLPIGGAAPVRRPPGPCRTRRHRRRRRATAGRSRRTWLRTP